jgi:transposase
MDVAVLGIDLGKNSCSVVGLDGSGKVVLRRRVQRKTIVGLAAKLSPCIIAMEACCGAHHLGRVLSADGHTVRLMSPEYVRPYVKAQKNDDRDAEAIAEAATRPTMRFVALKNEEQLDMQTLHRARDRTVVERTSLMNQLRAILLERGIIVPQGRAKLRLRLAELMRQGIEQLSSRIRRLIEDMLARWQTLDERIAAFDAEFSAEAKQNEAARRLTSIPGIGALNATALVAAVGDAQTFARARNLAAWLGLVPRQATTGGKASPAWHHQTWQQILAQDADSRRSRSFAELEPKQHSARRVVAWSPRESSFQYSCRRPRRQDGADRLGSAALRHNV